MHKTFKDAPLGEPKKAFVDTFSATTVIKKAYHLDELLAGMTENNVHEEVPVWPMPEPHMVIMPRELTDEQADAAMRATAVHLDIKGSQLTVNREKMKARYRALVKFIEEKPGVPSKL